MAAGAAALAWQTNAGGGGAFPEQPGTAARDHKLGKTLKAEAPRAL
jgi:hypothetical protein